MSYLLEHKTETEESGEPKRLWTEDLDGYDLDNDWRIEATGSSAFPKENCNWDKRSKSWKKCPIKTAESKEEAMCNNITHRELIKRLIQLEKEVEILKRK